MSTFHLSVCSRASGRYFYRLNGGHFSTGPRQQKNMSIKEEQQLKKEVKAFVLRSGNDVGRWGLVHSWVPVQAKGIHLSVLCRNVKFFFTHQTIYCIYNIYWLVCKNLTVLHTHARTHIYVYILYKNTNIKIQQYDSDIWIVYSSPKMKITV